MTKLNKDEKRLETLAVETETNKKKLVSELKRSPIIQIACKKVGVGRSTYYKWRFEDNIFAKACDQAMEFGSALINDIVESKLISLAQNSNLEAMKFWLRHNHSKYSLISKHITPFSLVSFEPTVEELNNSKAVIARNLTHRVGKQILRHELRKDSIDTELGLMVEDEIRNLSVNEYLRDEEAES